MIICLPSCDAVGCRRAFGAGDRHVSGAVVGAGACHPGSVGAGACFASFGVVEAYHPGFAAAGA